MSDGWASLSHKLGELPWATQSAIKKIAMGQATKKVQGTAKRKSPGFSGDLRKQIYTKTKFEADAIVGVVYSNNEHAAFVEFGTGPEGAENNSGISPNVSVSYRTDPWMIPGALLSRKAVNKYWAGRKYDPEALYWTDGQRAQPFLYPALKQNEEKLPRIFAKVVKDELRRLSI